MRPTDRPNPSETIVAAVALLLGWRPSRDASDLLPMRFDEPQEDDVRWRGFLDRFVAALAIQDWLLLFYVFVLFFGVLGGAGEHRPLAVFWVSLDVTGLMAVLLLVRGGVLEPGPFGAFLYRVAVIGALVGTFFQLQYILPTVSSRVVDGQIFALDVRLFGTEPALAWDRFVTPRTTEWFAFFYYGYFCILALHVLPFAFFVRDMKLLSEFSLGIVFLFVVAHLLYIVVPGYGPYWYLAEWFAHPLSGNFWWPLVRHTVESAGARKDIFPSLHTGAPTFLALFQLRHRARGPFKYTWPLQVVFTTQIVLATMFLRWHYLIDVCAGLTLATTASLFAARFSVWELRLRAARRLAPVWVGPLYLGRFAFPSGQPADAGPVSASGAGAPPAKR